GCGEHARAAVVGGFGAGGERAPVLPRHVHQRSGGAAAAALDPGVRRRPDRPSAGEREIPVTPGAANTSLDVCDRGNVEDFKADGAARNRNLDRIALLLADQTL